jgi:large subunit ribosomal protein L3
MLTGLIGKKIGMTQMTDAAGRVRAATVLTLGPCTVSQVKTAATDGYDAVQVTFGKRKLSRVTGAVRGHFAKANVAAGIKSGEFERRGEAELTLGQPIAASDVFKVGDQVDVTGVSKGHGYAGVIKRHHFSGFPGSHGTHEYFRHGGSRGRWATRPPASSTSKCSRYLPTTTRWSCRAPCPAPTALCSSSITRLARASAQM